MNFTVFPLGLNSASRVAWTSSKLYQARWVEIPRRIRGFPITFAVLQSMLAQIDSTTRSLGREWTARPKESTTRPRKIAFCGWRKPFACRII